MPIPWARKPKAMITNSQYQTPNPSKMRYDEIIVNLFILATSKGFNVYHYPIALFRDNGITKQKAFLGRLYFSWLKYSHKINLCKLPLRASALDFSMMFNFV